MDPDLAFIIGIFLAVFSIPSIMSALSDGRSPRVAAVMIVAGGALVVWAIRNNPNGYRFSDIADTLLRVVGKYLS
jgi:hypothetical protein